jgi:putative phosphoribosyl transferase
METRQAPFHHVEQIPSGDITLEGELVVPPQATGIVIFAHGSGSSRHSPRNGAVAAVLQEHGLATLLMDLLTGREEEEERYTRHHRFDIELLSRRLGDATTFVAGHAASAGLRIGYFGASTGAAAALVASTIAREPVDAVVSRGGRPDLAGANLATVTVPTLLIVGGADTQVIELNRQAMRRMQRAEVRLDIVANATHLFEEPGTLDQVATLAAGWFTRHLDTG